MAKGQFTTGISFESLAAKVQKTSIDRIIGTCDEGGFVRAKIKCKGCNLLGLSHSADRLRFFEFLEHLLLAPRIIAVKITIDKGRVHSGWRDAIAADVVGQVVLSYRIGHGHNRTLAHRIGEA